MTDIDVPGSRGTRPKRKPGDGTPKQQPQKSIPIATEPPPVKPVDETSVNPVPKSGNNDILSRLPRAKKN